MTRPLQAILFGGFDLAGKAGAVRPQGYAGVPGTGPVGERCGTCAYRCAVVFSRTYWKCLRYREHWSSDASTDIRLASPACEQWTEGDAAKSLAPATAAKIRRKARRKGKTKRPKRLPERLE